MNARPRATFMGSTRRFRASASLRALLANQGASRVDAYQTLSGVCFFEGSSPSIIATPSSSAYQTLSGVCFFEGAIGLPVRDREEEYQTLSGVCFFEGTWFRRSSPMAR